MDSLDNNSRAMIAIGRVCSRWADMEFLTTETTHALAPFLDEAFKRSEVKSVLEIAVTHADIRDRISIAKVLATQTGLPPKLYQRLESHLNRIDNELRLERNRFVHDEWIVTSDSALRTCIRPKVVRPQAFQVDMVFAESKSFQIEEVEAFADELDKAGADLLYIIQDIEAFYAERFPPSESPGSTPVA